MKLKYLTVSKGLYLYQRRYPTAILSHPSIKTKIYKKSLELNSEASKDLVLAAWKDADKTFSDYIELLSGANIEQLEQARKIELAYALIKANDLQPGMLSPDPRLSDIQKAALKEDAIDYVSNKGIFDELSHFDHPEFDHTLTPELEIQSIAWKMLESPKATNSQSICLSNCWDIYSKQKQLDETKSSVQKDKSRFHRLVSIHGDTLLSQDVVTEALNAYVDTREGEREKNKNAGKKATESPREFRRLVCMSHAALYDSSSC